MYIARALEARLGQMAGNFPAVMVCGARQTGKTTMLKHFQETHTEINYISLDNLFIRQMAKDDPELFLQSYKPPLIIDEFQYAPDLLSYIKIRVDEAGKNGMYFLSGSQLFHMMKNVTESMAGRIGIITMYPLSRAEIEGRVSKPFNPDDISDVESTADLEDIFQSLSLGGMPALASGRNKSPEDFFESYLNTYLERDVYEIIRLRNKDKFIAFLRCLAARTGQELNLNGLGKDVGIDQKTAENWISVLSTTGIIHLVQPFHSNLAKRIIKRPKLYFMDTGLAIHLAGWMPPEVLERSALSGAFFETYVVSEIIKSYANSGLFPHRRIFYYRDSSRREIDLVIADRGALYPIEIKKSGTPGKDAVKSFSALAELGYPVGRGAVVCMTPRTMPLDEKNTLVPVSAI